VSHLTAAAYIVLTLGVAVIAALSVAVGHWLARKSAKELGSRWSVDRADSERRWLRERSYELLDQALTRALAPTDETTRAVGRALLVALLRSEIIQKEDVEIIREAVAALLPQVQDSDIPDIEVVVGSSSVDNGHEAS
jgi:hypothetical protein